MNTVPTKFVANVVTFLTSRRLIKTLLLLYVGDSAFALHRKKHRLGLAGLIVLVQTEPLEVANE
jgi:hypothetical protein